MKNILRSEPVARARAALLERKRVVLSVTAFNAWKYLHRPLPALPVPGDARAEARMIALHHVGRRGALRDVRRYRLVCFVLGVEIPEFARDN